MTYQQLEPLIRADELEAIGAESSLARAMAAHTIRLLYKENEELRARLAQPEPVIQARKEGDLIVVDLPKVPTGGGGIYKDEQFEPTKLINVNGVLEKAGYVKKKEWVGLTKEDLETIHQDLFNMSGWSFNTMAKAIEAKLKQKNT